MDFQSIQYNCCFLWQWLIPQSYVVLISHTGSPSRGGAHACTLWKRHRDRTCAAWFRAQEGCIWHGSTNQESPVWPCLRPPGTTLSHEVQDFFIRTLHWRHNGHDSASNHQPHDCLLNRLFRRRSKKISKLRVTGLCAGNSPEISEFPAQMASNAENVSIWWRHHKTVLSVSINE